MRVNKITAVIPYTAIDKVEENLTALGVVWITVEKVRGHGEHVNYYDKDCMTDCIRIEVFIEEEKARCIADAICYGAYDGKNSDGMVAIHPVEEFIRVRDFKEAAENAC
jgi:nitrogen regulatory protein PII